MQSVRRWWRFDDGPPAEDASARPTGAQGLRSSLEGLLTNVLNPKVGLFYLAFLPQFIRPGDSVFARSLLLGALHVGIGIVWLSLLSWVRIRPLLEGASGAVLIALGLRLAAERR